MKVQDGPFYTQTIPDQVHHQRSPMFQAQAALANEKATTRDQVMKAMSPKVDLATPDAELQEKTNPP